MATFAEINQSDGVFNVRSNPVVEPLNAPMRFTERLERFGEHYNTNQDSHLYRFLVSLCGDAGAGQLKKELLYPRLQQLLGSTYFQDLDKLYGNPLGLSRFPAELYIYDPHNEALTNEQWIEVFAKDASYRERCLLWMRAIIEGPTPRGICMAAEAALGYECDVFEQYNYLDNQSLPGIENYGSTTSRNEFIVIPQVSDLLESERRQMMRLIDKLRPVNTISSIKTGTSTRLELPILDIGATSTRFTVLRNVTGALNIQWPSLDPVSGYWIDYSTNEAPTFAFLDRQEAATYLSIHNIEASTTMIGQFNDFQKSLFSHLSNLNDLYIHSPINAYSKAVAPLNVSIPWLSGGSSPADKLIVNSHYPIGYFTEVNTDVTVVTNNLEFWASAEKLAPAADHLIIDLDITRPLNFVDFNISHKPVDIEIEYMDENEAWIPLEVKEGFEVDKSLNYLPSDNNPWAYFEWNSPVINTNKLKLTFTRRDETFPQGNTEDHPWSIEVQNLRVIHLIQEQSDFVIDTGVDILGNVFETDIFEFDVANVIDPEDEFNTSYWQSQPNPTHKAVEALYFDLRSNSTIVTIGEMNTMQMEALDERSVGELNTYYTEGVVLDEVYIDPVTHGEDMHFYYSNDDTPDWDSKLWIPIPRHYVLRKGFHTLPSPLLTRYFKIEFSNLTPVPYQFIEYPVEITTKFRRYPTWVQNYFSDVYPTQPFVNDIYVYEQIKIDPIVFGYQQFVDALNTGYKDIRSDQIKSKEPEIEEHIFGILQGGDFNTEDKSLIENQIKYYSPLMWSVDLPFLLNPEGAMARIVQTPRNNLFDSGWAAEIAPPTYPPPVQRSTSDLSETVEEKSGPVLWFPRTCRHGYQLVEARFDNKIAYHVAIKEVRFHRRDLSVRYDEEYYLETLEDEANLTFNSLTQLDQYRWGVN